MRILITNDDGIAAPGLAVAEEIAAELAGPDGEVWIVAPDRERSGVSHCISYTSPFRVTEIGERRYVTEGFPADCALIGIRYLMADQAPDLLISGVNRGHNVAEDVVYSGTCGAAMEGALAGVPSVALSQFYRRDGSGPEDMWSSSRARGVEAIRWVLERGVEPRLFWNLNFPAVGGAEAEGPTLCVQGLREEATFEVEPMTAPNGREFLFYRHRIANHTAEAGSDARLVVNGHITVTPLLPQLTAVSALDRARAETADSRAAAG